MKKYHYKLMVKEKKKIDDDNDDDDNDDHQRQTIFVPNLCLKDLQKCIISDIGSKGFNNPILFIISSLLTQQFDDAINYLSKYCLLQSIHLGICLNYYGLKYIRIYL